MKKVICGLAVLAMLTGTVVCAEEFDEFYVAMEEETVTVILDRVTGVEYIVTDTGVCPRYNADGTLFTAEEEK